MFKSFAYNLGHSHSIINEPSKLLICNAPEAAPPKFTVIFCRQSAERQHWRGFPAGSAKTHLSRSIEDDRLLERSWTLHRASTRHSERPRTEGASNTV